LGERGSIEGHRPEDITAVVLAGGRARRMGGEDKGLVEVAGRPMVAWVLDALRPQVGAVMVNANRNRERYAAVAGCAVMADRIEGYAGPLAGMASALAAAESPLVLTAPCDSPLVSRTLAARLYACLERERAELSVAHDGERLQPVFALLRRHLLGDLLAFLATGERRIDRWYATRRMATADLSDAPDTFLNVNTPEDRAALEARLERARGC
jgi:molybdenum cofactor guanylyltransferase